MALSTKIDGEGKIDQISSREQDIIEQSLMDFREKQTARNTFAGQWEEAAELIAPNFRNTFFYGSRDWPGQKKTYRQIDASCMMANSRFAAICDSLLTPRNMYWHAIGADPVHQYLMKDHRNKLWYEQVRNILFAERYSENANFAGQNYAAYLLLGAFGNGPMFIDSLYSITGDTGLRYRCLPLGETYFGENHQGQLDSYIRHFRLTPRQAIQKWPDTFPEKLRAALERRSEYKYDFLHRVCPRMDVDYDRLDAKGKPWASYYISVDAQCLLSEGGYNTFPIACSRYENAPNEVYGRGPGQMVLPAAKTLNSQKATFLKQGHRASDPVLLTADDGLMDLSLRPGAMNKGGISAEGKRLVDILPTGNIQTNEKMMDMERALINDAFLVTLFQILTETPQMTATEVIERTNEKGILLAPTVGRQQSEYLGPLINRELDILAQLKRIPPMPPGIKEAKGHYHTVYTAPISRAMKAQEAAGFMRTVESVKELVNITGDASLLDPFDFDVAIPAIAEIQAVPESWMATKDKIEQKRQGRQQQLAQKQQVEALPAQAAMMKAQAVVAKNQPGIAQGQAAGGPLQRGGQ
jgi:Bacteriophage head to tail connecting protein